MTLPHKNSPTNPSRIRRGALALEKGLHRVWRPWTRLMGWREPGSIEAYRSWGNAQTVTVRGRVLGNGPEVRAFTTDGLREHLGHTLRRWLTFEVSGARVNVSFQGQQIDVLADSDGFFEARFGRAAGNEATRWGEAQSQVESERGAVLGKHEVLLPGNNARRLIISDVDDTTILTGATKLLTITRLTFFCGVHNRRVLEGVPKLYRELAAEDGQAEANPLFYVSSSAWNLYGLIVRILELGVVPRGPLMFQRLGLANNRFVREPGHRHKLKKIEGLLETYPELPAILIGDSGQHDAMLYAEAARLFPGRIEAIYIRDVEADQGTAHDLKIRAALECARGLGVPALRFGKSEELRADAQQRGWI